MNSLVSELGNVALISALHSDFVELDPTFSDWEPNQFVGSCQNKIQWCMQPGPLQLEYRTSDNTPAGHPDA